ncbi:MAG: hydrolase [Clostridiales bacterium]|nr:hydrolase [Clostridiales bacterium]
MDIQEQKQYFLNLAKQNIKREGIDKLLEYLEKTDFFEAPASTKFHSNFLGGLCFHSLKVYERFVKRLQTEYGEAWQDKVSLETACIIALFHDICKVNTYKTDVKNVKENGVWVQKPYFAYSDPLPYGHGEKSVYIINGFLRLTREEAMAINWHMGSFDPRVKGGFYGLENVFYSYPTALLFHLADIEATYLDETQEN